MLLVAARQEHIDRGDDIALGRAAKPVEEVARRHQPEKGRGDGAVLGKQRFDGRVVAGAQRLHIAPQYRFIIVRHDIRLLRSRFVVIQA